MTQVSVQFPLVGPTLPDYVTFARCNNKDSHHRHVYNS